MEELFGRLKNVFDEDNNDYSYNGLIIYLLSDEESPYRIYRINVESNNVFNKIITNNIFLAENNVNFFRYPDCTSPDGNENVSYLGIDEIPQYNVIKENINNAIDITKEQLLNIISTIKGYVIKILYTDNAEATQEKEILCFSKLTQSSFFKPDHPLFSFGNGNEDFLKEVKGLFLKFSEKIAAINIEDTVFILHGYYFEQLLKYDEHINTSAAIVKEDIRNQGLIENIDLLDTGSENNKNIRKLLYKIGKAADINDITIDKFKDLKNKYQDKLLYTINDNNTINIREDAQSKSIMHILRIYNDEAAETIVSGKGIFAHQKIDIE